MEIEKTNKKHIHQVVDLKNKEQLQSIITMLKSKKKVMFDRKYFMGDVIVNKDWRTKLLIKTLEYILEEK